MLSPVTEARPRFVVCEDGTEYLERFSRFLGDDFTFVAAADFESARAAAAGADGLLLDLDFRRTPPDRLIDERGAVPGGLDPERRRRLAETQGSCARPVSRCRRSCSRISTTTSARVSWSARWRR